MFVFLGCGLRHIGEAKFEQNVYHQITYGVKRHPGFIQETRTRKKTENHFGVFENFQRQNKRT